MDFFDLAKLFRKWWFVVVPMVVLTLVATPLLSNGVQPEYTASGSVMISGPNASQSSDEGTGDERNVANPLVASGGLPTTAYVTALSINSPQVASILADEGLSSTYEASAVERLPIIQFETRAASREAATQTAIRLVELIDAELSVRQDAAGVTPGERVTSEVIEVAAAGGADYSGRNRLRIVILGVGLACVAGAVFLAEGLAQRRRRRRSVGQEIDVPNHDDPAGSDDEVNSRRGESKRDETSRTLKEHLNGSAARHPATVRIQRSPRSRSRPRGTERVRQPRAR